MKINAEFDKRVIVHSEQLDWVASPMAGVMRRPLDRVGAEVARATSIVRYDQGSQFSRHVHTGGEEFIVLEGVFQDEHGDFPVGSYIRNPPQSSHTPGSEQGCIIFVKLWQFEPDDRVHVHLNINAMFSVPVQTAAGVCVMPLYQDNIEQVALYTFSAGAEFSQNISGGAELFVIEGTVMESGDQLLKHSWLRQPTGSQLRIKAGPDGARVWLKTGHIAQVDGQVQRVLAVA